MIGQWLALGSVWCSLMAHHILPRIFSIFIFSALRRAGTSYIFSLSKNVIEGPNVFSQRTQIPILDTRRVF